MTNRESPDELRAMLGERSGDVRMSPLVIDAAIRLGRAHNRRRMAAAGVLTAAVVIAAPLLWTANRPDAVVTPVPTTSVPSASPRPSASPSPTTTTPSPTVSRAPLPVGAAPAIPYAVGRTLVVGDTQIQLPGDAEQFVAFQDKFAVVTLSSTGRRLYLVGADGTSLPLDESDDVFSVAASSDAGHVAWGTAHEFTTADGLLSASYALHVWSPSSGSHSLPVESVDLANAAAMVNAVIGDQVVFSYAADPGGAPMIWDTTTDALRGFIPGLDEIGNTFGDLTPGGEYALINTDGGACWAVYRVNDGTRLWRACDDENPGVGELPAEATTLHQILGLDLVAPALGAGVRLPLPDYFGLNAWAFEDDADVLVAGLDPDTGSPEILRCVVGASECELAPPVQGLGNSVVFGSE